MNPSALDPRTHPYRADLAADWLAGRVEAGRFVAGDDHVVVRGSAPLRRAPAAGARSGASVGPAASTPASASA